MAGTLIFGAGGQLGKELSFVMKDAICFEHSKESLTTDVENKEWLEKVFSKYQPEVVINAAAYTDVDGCEIHRERAFSTNALAVKNIANLCGKYSSRFFHVSTDYVFDGKTGSYHENDVPSPINYYGLSKIIGDAFALSYDRTIVIRTSGVYGRKNNFPLFLYNSMKSGNRMKIIKGYYSPIHARLLAKSMMEIIEKHSELHGVINIAGVRVSRMELARSIASRFNLEFNDPEEVDFIPSLKAARPYDSSLDISYGKTIIGFDFYSLDRNLSCFADDLNRKENIT